MRNCCEVIREIISYVPLNKMDLIKDLEWNYNDAIYKAPEETKQWFNLQETLMEHITVPKEEWEFQIYSIFSTVPIEDIKNEIKKHEKNKN